MSEECLLQAEASTEKAAAEAVSEEGLHDQKAEPPSSRFLWTAVGTLSETDWALANRWQALVFFQDQVDETGSVSLAMSVAFEEAFDEDPFDQTLPLVAFHQGQRPTIDSHASAQHQKQEATTAATVGSFSQLESDPLHQHHKFLIALANFRGESTFFLLELRLRTSTEMAHHRDRGMGLAVVQAFVHEVVCVGFVHPTRKVAHHTLFHLHFLSSCY